MALIGLEATSISLYGKGVSRYQYGLIKGLCRLDKKNTYFVLLNKDNPLPQLPREDNFQYVYLSVSKRIAWDQFQLPAIIKKYNPDIYHTTADTIPLFCKNKFLLYLFEIPDHRIALLRRCPGNSVYAWVSQSYSKFLFPKSLKKAAIITAGSLSTKNDLIARYKIPAEKVRVLYPAADERFCPAKGGEKILETRARYNAQNGYLLHISSPDPRDNTYAAIRAYEKARRRLKQGKKLLIYGDIGSDAGKLAGIVKGLNLEKDIIFTGRFKEEEVERLAELYQAADLYIDPSLYEGFGFQVLEAMACGIPVIASNVTSLPEVLGDAGITAGPDDIDGLAQAIVDVLTDQALRRDLCRKSLLRAELFSWDRTARETLAVYELLMNLN